VEGCSSEVVCGRQKEGVVLTVCCYATTDDAECIGSAPPGMQGANDVLMERLKKRKAPAELSADEEGVHTNRKEQKMTETPAAE
jgi:hypothetical protein